MHRVFTKLAVAGTPYPMAGIHATALIAAWLAFLAFVFLCSGVTGQAGPPRPSDPTKPCILNADARIGYLTATNKCPNDTFQVALVRNATQGPPRIFAMGADEVGLPPEGEFQWIGPPFGFTKSWHVPDERVRVVVLRNADGKVIIPKGIKPGGTLVDVSSTKQRICELFWKDQPGFAIFRATLSADGTRVVGNDFARGNRSEPSSPGTPCEQYYETGPPPVEGVMVDVYDTGSCRVVLDDCSK